MKQRFENKTSMTAKPVTSTWVLCFPTCSYYPLGFLFFYFIVFLVSFLSVYSYLRDQWKIIEGILRNSAEYVGVSDNCKRLLEC